MFVDTIRALRAFLVDLCWRSHQIRCERVDPINNENHQKNNKNGSFEEEHEKDSRTKNIQGLLISPVRYWISPSSPTSTFTPIMLSNLFKVELRCGIDNICFPMNPALIVNLITILTSQNFPADLQNIQHHVLPDFGDILHILDEILISLNIGWSIHIRKLEGIECLIPQNVEFLRSR